MMNSRNENNPDKQEAKTSRPCPICGKPQASSYRPFCSKRCADIDLHRWLSGAYVVMGEPFSATPETPIGTEDD